MLVSFSTCPDCNQSLHDRLQTICYHCYFFILVQQVREEAKQRQQKHKALKDVIRQEIDDIIDSGGKIGFFKEIEYREMLTEAEKYVRLAYKEGYKILKAREQFLKAKPNKSEQDRTELLYIPQQMKQLELEAGPLEDIEVDMDKVFKSIQAAFSGYRRGMETGDTEQAIARALEGLFGTLGGEDKKPKKQIAEKSEIEIEKEKIRKDSELIELRDQAAYNRAARIIMIKKKYRDQFNKEYPDDPEIVDEMMDEIHRFLVEGR